MSVTLSSIILTLMLSLAIQCSAFGKDVLTADKQTLLRLADGLKMGDDVIMKYNFTTKKSKWHDTQADLRAIQEEVKFKSVRPIGGTGNWYSSFLLITTIFDSESHAYNALKNIEKYNMAVTKCHAYVIADGNRMYMLVAGCEQPSIFYKLLDNFKKNILSKNAQYDNAVRCKPGGSCRFGSGEYKMML